MAKFCDSPFCASGADSSVSLLMSLNTIGWSFYQTVVKYLCFVPMKSVKESRTSFRSFFELGECKNSGNQWFSHVSNDWRKFELLKIVSTYLSMMSIIRFMHDGSFSVGTMNKVQSYSFNYSWFKGVVVVF